MNRTTRLIVIITTTVFFAGCVGESVPPEQAAMEWEDQARVYEKTSEWEKVADAWGEAAEAWEKQADTWKEIGDMTQASEAREKAAVDWEARAKACREAYEWRQRKAGNLLSAYRDQKTVLGMRRAAGSTSGLSIRYGF